MYIPKLISNKGESLAGFLFRGVREDYSSNSIINILKEHGYGYRRSEMLKDIRLYRVAWEKFEAIKRLPDHVTPPKDYFIGAKDVTIPKRYLYTYREIKTNSETGERSESYHTYATDILENKQDVKIQMGNQSILSKYYDNITIEDQEIVNAYLGGKE